VPGHEPVGAAAQILHREILLVGIQRPAGELERPALEVVAGGEVDDELDGLPLVSPDAGLRERGRLRPLVLLHRVAELDEVLDLAGQAAAGEARTQLAKKKNRSSLSR
jgi:hypothetical protein